MQAAAITEVFVLQRTVSGQLFFELMKTKKVIEEIKKFDESTYIVGEFPIARRVFEVFVSHSQEIELLLGENGDSAFRDKFQTAISNYFVNLIAMLVESQLQDL